MKEIDDNRIEEALQRFAESYAKFCRCPDDKQFIEDTKNKLRIELENLSHINTEDDIVTTDLCDMIEQIKAEHKKKQQYNLYKKDSLSPKQYGQSLLNR